jgi:hypothetical protein
MLEYLPLIYWIGYGICFTVIFVFGTWAIVNENDVDFLNVLFAVIVFPFFSWLLILFILLGAFFEHLKDK